MHSIFRFVMSPPRPSLFPIIDVIYPSGVYLTDLTFIEDGIPSIIKKTNLINFAKRTKTAEVIRDIQQYQNVGYSLQSVPDLQDYILSNMQAAGDVHEMYDKSLDVEPREREDEKIVRYVSAFYGEFGACTSLFYFPSLSPSYLTRSPTHLPFLIFAVGHICVYLYCCLICVCIMDAISSYYS